MEVVNVMIHDQDLLINLWAEATRSILYVKNTSPHRVLGNKTPEEMFIGENPEFIHLRIFGCLVYVHVPKEKRSKLDPLDNKGIFVGYSETSNEYNVYIPGHCQTDTRRYFTFVEDETFSKSWQHHSYEVHDEAPIAPKVTYKDAGDDVVLEDYDIG